MSSLLESEAQLVSRAQEIGLPPATIQAIKEAGVTNLSGLASVVSQPGQALATADFDHFLTSLG